MPIKKFMTSKKSKSCDCKETEKMAEALKALGHPVRLKIVQELKALDSCCCADMCDCFSQSQSTISQHLSVLKEAGIVNFAKDGNKSCFTLNHDTLKEIQSAMSALYKNPMSGAKID